MFKYSSEIKIKACEAYLYGELSHQEICSKYGIEYNQRKHNSIITRNWMYIYRTRGPEGFLKKTGNNKYTSEFKMMIIEEYIKGNGSFMELSAKYGISSSETLRQWFLMYNANRELKDYCPEREVYMAEAKRKTTIEERKEIVEYCLNHSRDYKGTASIYNVSYSQVYSWVKKYDAHGEEGLTDKRGRHKTDEEVDELERLRRENARLKRQLQEKDMLAELLKKVQEFERM